MQSTEAFFGPPYPSLFATLSYLSFTNKVNPLIGPFGISLRGFGSFLSWAFAILTARASVDSSEKS